MHGKAGRAETATDPAQLDMNESVVTLRPREEWPPVRVDRWYSDRAPEWLKRALAAGLARAAAAHARRARRAISTAALRMPGYQMAISPPIRTRIDMLTTGVRTPVGIKVFGDDLHGHRACQPRARRAAARGARHAQHVRGAADRARVHRHRAEPRCDRALRTDRARRAGRRRGGHRRHAGLDGDRRSRALLRSTCATRPTSAPIPTRCARILVPVQPSASAVGARRRQRGRGPRHRADGAGRACVRRGTGGGMGAMGGGDRASAAPSGMTASSRRRRWAASRPRADYMGPLAPSRSRRAARRSSPTCASSPARR